MARETLKDFLNKKGSASDSISYVMKEGKDGLGVDPGTNSELVDLINDAGEQLEDCIATGAAGTAAAAATATFCCGVASVVDIPDDTPVITTLLLVEYIP